MLLFKMVKLYVFFSSLSASWFWTFFSLQIENHANEAKEPQNTFETEGTGGNRRWFYTWRSRSAASIRSGFPKNMENKEISQNNLEKWSVR